MMEDPTGKDIPLGYPRGRAMGRASLIATMLLGLSAFKGEGVPGVETRMPDMPDTTETTAEYLERERRDRTNFPSRKKRLRARRGK